MINGLVVCLFASILGIEYLIRERDMFNSYLLLMPELLSAIVMAIVLARMMAGARFAMDGRYLVFFVALIATMLAGFVIQDVPAGPIVAGIRAHLKFIPFFLLPVVFRFTPAQLRTQFFVLMALFLVQTPLALYQRFVEYADTMQTGDPVRGTATTSSALSLLMLCGIAAVVSLYLRRKIGLPLVLAIVAMLFLPTTLNETKATLVLLPIALILPALVMPRGEGAVRRMLPIIAIGSLAAFAFIVVYDYLIQYSRYGQPIGEFVGNAEGGFLRYLYAGSVDHEVNYIGRFDSLVLALKGIGGDPFTAAFGLGAGNVSTSFIPQFDGEYAAYYDRYGVGMTQVSALLWQVGFVGLVTYLLLYYYVLRDAYTLSRGDAEFALLGQIWVAVAVIMTLALAYKSVFSMNEIGYLFWFYSGVVAARAAEQRAARKVLRASHGREQSVLSGAGAPDVTTLGWRT